ncbi:hypothetical protein ES703_124757 [subsurface metagenome]
MILDTSTNKVVFKIRIGSVSNYLSISNITPTDEVGSIQLLSSVSKVTAGKYINAPVTVRIYDLYNNLKYDATNSIYFTNTDKDGIFTNGSGNKYKFNTTDAGEHIFGMSNFVYTKAGTKDLIVTNEQWGRSDRIGSIEVVPTDVSGFIANLSVSTAEAGRSFYISVTGATDIYGNAVDDTAYISITNSGISSTLNDIVISSGIGSNSQTIFTSTTNWVVFKIRMGTYSNYISISNVSPTDEVANIQLLSSVSKVTAGKYINAPVTVRIYDLYNNIKYDATNSIYFTNTDGDGIFTNSSGNPYQFTTTDNGQHFFSISNFMYRVAGIKNLIVTNEQWGLSDRIGGIEVVAADVSGFIANLSVSTGIAGQSFYIRVTGATDIYGNGVDGTAYISITNSDIVDYTVNDIAVNSGIGSNIQVILDTSTNNVVFKIRIGSISNYIALSNITPTDDMGSIQLISSVTKVTAGRYINAPVQVRIYDLYNNLKINATNSIYYTSYPYLEYYFVR